MPRKNNRKVEPHNHGPSIFDRRYKVKCYGCAFAGKGFVCLTSDGQCLKTAPSISGADNRGSASRTGKVVGGG